MNVRIVDITPELARELLSQLAPYQRRIDRKHVASLEADMRAGRWTPNGSPIRFDADGRLCDGQHRLAAAIAADITLRQCVVIGDLSVQAYSTIDTNARGRTALQIARQRQQGLAPSTNSIAAVGLEHYNFQVTAYETRSTPMERVELWEQLPEHLQHAVKKLGAAARTQRITSRGAMAAALRCMMERGERMDAFAFFAHAFANDPHQCSPQGRLLFNTLARAKGRKKDPSVEEAIAWSCMRAFAAYLRNEGLQILRPPVEWPADQRSLATILKGPTVRREASSGDNSSSSGGSNGKAAVRVAGMPGDDPDLFVGVP